MKNNILIFVLFILTCSPTARLLRPEEDHGDKGLKHTQINLAADSLTTEINDLMGIEKCEEENEECLKRRMIADAHLDYIYTQHHNP